MQDEARTAAAECLGGKPHRGEHRRLCHQRIADAEHLCEAALGGRDIGFRQRRQRVLQLVLERLHGLRPAQMGRARAHALLHLAQNLIRFARCLRSLRGFEHFSQPGLDLSSRFRKFHLIERHFVRRSRNMLGGAHRTHLCGVERRAARPVNAERTRALTCRVQPAHRSLPVGIHRNAAVGMLRADRYAQRLLVKINAVALIERDRVRVHVSQTGDRRRHQRTGIGEIAVGLLRKSGEIRVQTLRIGAEIHVDLASELDGLVVNDEVDRRGAAGLADVERPLIALEEHHVERLLGCFEVFGQKFAFHAVFVD